MMGESGSYKIVYTCIIVFETLTRTRRAISLWGTLKVKDNFTVGRNTCADEARMNWPYGGWCLNGPAVISDSSVSATLRWNITWWAASDTNPDRWRDNVCRRNGLSLNASREISREVRRAHERTELLSSVIARFSCRINNTR